MFSDGKLTETAQKIKQRLFAIIEHQLSSVISKAKKSQSQTLLFNEALLEQWRQLLCCMLQLKQRKHTANINQQHQSMSKHQKGLPVLKVIPAQIKQTTDKLLLKIDANQINVYSIDSISKAIKPTQMQFSEGLVKKYSAYCHFQQSKYLLFGGCMTLNPNHKSRDIMLLDSSTKQISKIAELPYGLSSHCAVRFKNKVYIVGGNKNFNIVTKHCIQYDLESKQCQSMADLNYASASHTVLEWRGKCLFKIGGIGNCFGKWDLSPYIQRYSLEERKWTVINPKLKINQALLTHYSLFANCLAYESTDNSIVIMGGFDFTFKGSNKMLEMTIIQDQQTAKGRENYQIAKLGIVQHFQSGGFMQASPVYNNGSFFILQTMSNDYTTKVLKLGKNVSYA